MNAFRLGSFAVVLAVLVGCRADEDVPPPAFEELPPPVEEPAPVAPAAGRANLQGVADSGVTGEVLTLPRMDRTDITVMLSSAPTDESLGARIQSGTCESPGVVVANLDAISTDNAGRGQSTTDVGHAPTLILDGNHIVTVYAPDTEPERDMPIACATLPATM